MVKKKSYNPFKMWGSWIGGITGIIFGYKSLELVVFDFYDVLFFVTKTIPIELFGNIQSAIIHGTLGFLIGWGIHSLFRRFK